MSAEIIEAGKKLSSGRNAPIAPVPSRRAISMSLSDICLPRVPEITRGQEAEIPPQISDNIKIQKRDGIATRMINSYFSPKSFEENGSLYKKLGVEYFKHALMKTVGKYLLATKEITGQTNGYCLGGHSIKDLQATEKWSRFHEAAHLGVITLTILPTTASSIINWEAPTTLRTTVLTIAFAINAYCVMVQRFNRERLYKAISAKEQKRLRETTE